jgi:hypothetical protein
MGAAQLCSVRPLSAQEGSSCRASLFFYLQRRELNTRSGRERFLLVAENALGAAK